MNTDSQKPVTLDYFLKPGYIYLPEKPTVISTVLGSSVSVSLYDRTRKTGGMNHFLFPQVDAGEQTTALYGNISVVTLIRMMLENGSDLSNLEAQLFGGAHNPASCPRDIGEDNVKTARNILNQKQIKISSEDVGGQLGRKIVFNTLNNEILILKVGRLRDSDWYPYEDGR
ncbi:MAG: chemotaxis protein CheD [Proteobacteria bacterium]|nr:chemotaxis protein CheD [Desulfobacula sp.]MBU4132805.1 chemotaxis protein CheD [Pseudomonadota bacterium]